MLREDCPYPRIRGLNLNHELQLWIRMLDSWGITEQFLKPETQSQESKQRGYR